MERKITEQEERAYRLVHHDFEGKTVKEASEVMGVTSRQITRLLRSVKAKAPQLFPILTPKESAIYNMITKDGITEQQIALVSSISVKSIEKTIERIRSKGVVIPNVKAPIRYTPGMDAHVKEVF